MAGAIKGITIEFDGNTTKLSKAIGDVNKESKTLQQELRGINTLLKMDPSSTELLSQKQKVLSESISTTKDKLEKLKSVQEQVNEQFEKGDIGEKEYRDFQREIEATEQKLKSLNNEMKEFGSVSAQKIAAAGAKVQDIGGKIEGVGKAMMPVTASVTGLGAASITAFKELDSGYDTIVTATGATGDALENLKHSANDVYGSMNASMDEVGGAIGEVNTRFGFTDEKLTNVTSTFLKFAKITGQDVVTAVGNTDKIMEAWNIHTDDAGKLLGLLAGKAQETGISVDTLEESLMRNGSTFKEMGLSVEQSIGLLAQFESRGVDSSIAIAGLRKAVQNATKDGLSADEAIRQSIESIEQASSETEALSIASELFGTKGAAEMTRAIREGRISFDDINTSMNDYADTVSNTYEATQDPTDKMKVAFNNLKLAGAELGQSILTTLHPAIEKLSGFLKSVSEQFQLMPDSTKQLIVVFGGIAAAIGPALVIIGKLVSSIGSIMKLAPMIKGALSAITAAIGGISAPVVAIIAVVAALAAAFIHLIKTNDEFRGKIVGVFENIKLKIGELGNKIIEFVNSFGFEFSSFGEMIKGLWEELCNFLAPIFSAVFDEIGLILSSACDIIMGILDVFIGVFTGNWSQVWEGVKGIFGGAWDFIMGTFSNHVEIFMAVYGDLISKISETWTKTWNGMKDVVSDIWSSIMETVYNAWNSITTFFTQSIPNFFQTVLGWLGNMLSNVTTWTSNMTSKAAEMGNNFMSNIINAIKELPSKLQSFLSSALSNVASWVSSMGSKGREAITSLINNAVSAASSIPSKMGEIGRNIVNGVWNGIVSAKNAFVNNVTNFFRGIVDGVKDALGIHSPSTVFANEIGYWIPPGIGKGVEKNADAAISPIKRLFDDLFSSDLTPVHEFTANAAPTVVSNDYSAILTMMSIIADKLGNNKIYLDGKTLVGTVINYIDEELSRISAQKARGM